MYAGLLGTGQTSLRPTIALHRSGREMPAVPQMATDGSGTNRTGSQVQVECKSSSWLPLSVQLSAHDLTLMYVLYLITFYFLVMHDMSRMFLSKAETIVVPNVFFQQMRLAGLQGSVRFL